MARIHFVVSEAAKANYQARARREDKSLGQWMREAADEKVASARPRLFTVEEMKAFWAQCDAKRAQAPEPDWPDIKSVITESRLDRPERLLTPEELERS